MNCGYLELDLGHNVVLRGKSVHFLWLLKKRRIMKRQKHMICYLTILKTSNSLTFDTNFIFNFNRMQ